VRQHTQRRKSLAPRLRCSQRAERRSRRPWQLGSPGDLTYKGADDVPPLSVAGSIGVFRDCNGLDPSAFEPSLCVLASARRSFCQFKIRTTCRRRLAGGASRGGPSRKSRSPCSFIAGHCETMNYARHRTNPPAPPAHFSASPGAGLRPRARSRGNLPAAMALCAASHNGKTIGLYSARGPRLWLVKVTV
jgi:hypothetical protein